METWVKLRGPERSSGNLQSHRCLGTAQSGFLQTPEPWRSSDTRMLSPREIVISYHFASHVNLISMPVPVASKTTNYHHRLQVMIKPHCHPRMVLACFFFDSYQPPHPLKIRAGGWQLSMGCLRPKRKVGSLTKPFSLESELWCYWQRELGGRSVRGRG